MLKNNSNSTVVLRWDGANVTVPGGATVDVCKAFNIPPSVAIQNEAFFMQKFPVLVRLPQPELDGPESGVTPGTVTENPFKAAGDPDAQETEAEKTARLAEEAAAAEAEKPKELEDMTVDELRNFLIEKNEIENWDGKTKKADLLKLAQDIKAKG